MRSAEIPKRTPDDPPKQREKKTPEREKGDGGHQLGYHCRKGDDESRSHEMLESR